MQIYGHCRLETVLPLISCAEFIESTPPFSRLSATDQRHLASICIAQDFQKKVCTCVGICPLIDGWMDVCVCVGVQEVLVRVGEMSQWMFIIMSGKVMLTDKLHNRVNTLKTGTGACVRMHTIRTHTDLGAPISCAAGDLVGSFAFLNGTRHRVTATGELLADSREAAELIV